MEDLQEELDPVALLVLLCWFLYGWPQRRVLLRRAYLLSSVDPLWASMLAMYIILYFWYWAYCSDAEKWEMRNEKREKRGLWKIPRRMRKKVKEIEEGKRTGIIRKMAILLPFVIAFCMLALRLFRVALIPCFVDGSLPDGRSTTHVRLLCFFFFGKLNDDIKKMLGAFLWGKKLKCRMGAIWGDDVACDVWEHVYKVNVN